MGKRIVKRSKKFDKILERIKGRDLRIKIWKQMEKIIREPESGDLLRHGLKGMRKMYVHPFRLIYIYDKKKDTVEFLDFDHRGKIYRR